MAGTTSTYRVPDISCGHCKAAIESEVGEVAGVASVVVDVDSRTVTVDGQAGEAEVVGAIREAGYEISAD